MSQATDRSVLQRVLEIARAELGTKEIPGAGHNPRILEYHQTTQLQALRDEVPWCSAFVNWCLAQAGIEGTGSPMARSFLGWGAPLDHPLPGCVVVLKRGRAPFGHVAFFVRWVKPGLIEVLGGNQSDEVRLSVYRDSDVLGYRRPKNGAV